MTKKEINEIKGLYDTIEECGISRLCGCYVNGDKEKVKIFSESFLNLDEKEQHKYLEIFRKNMSGTLGKNLIDLSFVNQDSDDTSFGKGMLNALKRSELNDDVLLDKLEIIDIATKIGTYETSIEVEATGHPSTEVRDVLEATCQKEGYSGDTWCKTCESIVEKGSSIAKKDHGWHGEAINKENETKYPFIEIKGVKESTCKEEGYSGDIWCKECKIELKKGTVIAKKEHTWDEGVVTEEATRLEKGTKSYTCTTCQENKTEEIPEIGAHKKGSKIRDKQNKGIYKVTKAALSGGTVEYVKPVNKKKSTVSIPSTIKVDGVTYKVTSIANNAFKNNKKIKKLTIGKNVSRIGTKAFYGCKKLKTIAIKTTKLKTKNIGSKAFNGIASKATIKVPKAT